MKETLKNRLGNLERSQAVDDSRIEQLIDRAYWMEVLYLHSPRRNPINEALAYRRPFPEWTSQKFVEVVGSEPAYRHPYAACLGFVRLIPFELHGYVRTDRERQYLADAERWRDDLIVVGSAELAKRFWAIVGMTSEELARLDSLV